MPQTIRPATPQDIPRLVELLLLDAAERQVLNERLWRVAENSAEQIETAVTFALTAEQQPFRQFWHVSDDGGRLTGVVHSMLLPVPPIYLGPKGEPGLILPDSFVVPDAPEDTVGALMDVAEDTLRRAGARIILSSLVGEDAWRDASLHRGYEALTLYLSRSGLEDRTAPSDIRHAAEADIPGIVARSAENRKVLFDIDPFWEIHPEADTRFSGWMTRSLSLRDRDMLVFPSAEHVAGYVIAQPASRLHFPPAHDITRTGVIDDYYHPEFVDPSVLIDAGAGATALLRAAETAFARRGIGTAFVVCPAGWRSKREMLNAAGYETAMVWSIKR